MGNDNVYARLFKLWAMICKMILNKTRDPYDVVRALAFEVDVTGDYREDDRETDVYEQLWKLWALLCKKIWDQDRDPYDAVKVLQSIVDHPTEATKIAEKSKEYLDLDHPFTVSVGATDGTKTFASSGVFEKVHGVTAFSKRRNPTLATNAILRDVALSGTSAQLFGSLGKNRRPWQESQVIAFCEEHWDTLRRNGYCSFLFEISCGQVACVYSDHGRRPSVYVENSSDGYVWHIKYAHHVVSLEQ